MSIDEGGEGKNSSSFYKVLLVVLALVIIGLIVTMVVINLNRSTSEPETNYSLPEALMGDNLSPRDQVIKEAAIMLQTPGISMDEVEKYYDDAISKANEDGEYYLAMDIIVQKLLFFVVEEGDCEKAKDYSENVDVSKYSDEEKGYLQSYMYSVLLDCVVVEEDE